MRLEDQQVGNLYRALNRTRFGDCLPACDVRFSARLTSSGGVCYPSRRRIRLSSYLLREHGWPAVAETLLHEMVHLWVDCHIQRRGRSRPRPHGPEFRAVLAAVGGQYRHCPPFGTGQLRRFQVYRCPQGHQFVRRRRLAPGVVCAACYQARLPAMLCWVGERLAVT